MAVQAAAEMNDKLASPGAGPEINNLVTEWATAAASGVVRDDYAVVNLGQLKAVAKLFYDRLAALYLVMDPPWQDGTADDYAVANLGQLKNVFSFDPVASLAYASTDNGIPDWWLRNAGLDPTDPSNASRSVANPTLTMAQYAPAGSYSSEDANNPITYLIAYQADVGAEATKDAHPLQELPSLDYVAIDVSSGVTTADVYKVGINDSNQVAFLYQPADSMTNMRTTIFKDGNYLAGHDYPIQGSSGYYNLYYSYKSCNAYGEVAGIVNNIATEAGGNFARLFTNLGGSPSLFWPYSEEGSWYLPQLGFPTNDNGPDGVVNIGNLDYVGGGYSGDLESGSFVGFLSSVLWYPDYYNGGPNYAPSVFSPDGVNAGVYVPGFPKSEYAVCAGTSFNSIGHLQPLAVSDNGQVLGDDKDANDEKNSLSVRSGATTWNLHDLLLAKYEKYKDVIRFPRTLSPDNINFKSLGSWINGNVDLVVTAELYDNSVIPAKWVAKSLLWKKVLATDDTSTITIANPPTNAALSQFNGSNIFAGTMLVAANDVNGNPTTRTAAALLLPVEFEVTKWEPVITQALDPYTTAWGNRNPPENQIGDKAFVAEPPNGKETFVIKADVKLKPLPIPAADLARVASEWKIAILQDVVALPTPFRETYIGEPGGAGSRVTSLSPVPGMDALFFPGEPDPDNYFPHKKFTTGNETLSLEDSDSPLPGGGLGVGIYRSPNSATATVALTNLKGDATFMTWVYAEHIPTKTRHFLKWVRWQVSWDVDVDGTHFAPPQVIKKNYSFHKIDEGTGQGPVAPTFTKAQKSYQFVPAQ